MDLFRNESEMRKKAEELEKDCLITFSQSSGFSPAPGTTRFIVTKDKKLHAFTFYHSLTPDMIEKGVKYESSTEYEVPDELYNELERFIEENIRGKQLEPQMIYDASFSISGPDFNAENYMDLYQQGTKIIRRIMEANKQNNNE